jgi:hypothetical protein
VWLWAAATAALPHPAAAQAPVTPDRPVLMAIGQYGGPQRIAGGLGVFLPFGTAESDDNLKRQKAVVIQGTAGRGGYRIGAGLAWLTGPFGPDGLITVTRTTTRARDAAAGETYVGVEGGYLFVFVRPTVGVAYRVTGAEGRRRTGAKFGVSVLVPFDPF